MLEVAPELLNGQHSDFKLDRHEDNSVSLIPLVKFPDDYNRYSITISLMGNFIKTEVIFNMNALGMVSAIRHGYQADSSPVHKSRAKLESMNCDAVISFETGTPKIEAINNKLTFNDKEDFDNALSVAIVLNELCFSYLRLTPLNPYSPSIPRNIESVLENDPWEYDPTERDRQTLAHRNLENWLIGKVQDHSMKPLDPGNSSVKFDVAWEIDSATFAVCEVKSITESSEVKQIRLGIGQVLHYAVQIEAHYQNVIPCLLVDHKPGELSLLELAKKVNVLIFWPEEDLPSALTSIGP